jgi:hypothetical protein
MTKALGLLLFVAALAQGETPVIPATEIYSHIRWGMTEEQVLGAFPEALGETTSLMASPDPMDRSLKTRLSTVALNLRDARGIPVLSVHFFFDFAGKLNAVLYSECSPSPADDQFTRMENTLTSEYGTPTFRGVQDTRRHPILGIVPQREFSTAFVSAWLLPNSVIQINYLPWGRLDVWMEKRTNQTKATILPDYTEVHGAHQLLGVSQPAQRVLSNPLAPQGVLTNPSAPPMKATISNGSPQSGVKEVVYQVDGTSKYVNLTLVGENGGKEQSQVKLPFELKFYAKGGQYLYLSAQKARITKRVLHVLGDQDDVVDDGVAGTVHVLIRVSGGVLREATTNTPYGIATADEKLPD